VPWWRDYRHLSCTVRLEPTLAVSTVIVVAARKALFFTIGGQLTRSRSPHATRIDANKSATKLTRQIMLAFLHMPQLPAGIVRILLLSFRVFRRQFVC
jgi:hypothetical protein